MRIYYSQNKEELFIKAFLPDIKNGFYIDVGAGDPIIDSVTKLFYDEGWKGINIDPIHKNIVRLNELRPRDINLEIGLGDKNSKEIFTEYTEEGGLSTFDKTMKEKYQGQTDTYPAKKHKDYNLEIKTLATIIQEQDVKHVDFIKIDVEGYEYEVINGYKWKDIRPTLICIEANHIVKDWRPLLEHFNYQLVFFDGLNNYYLAKESINRKEFFDYHDSVLAGGPVYYYSYQTIKQDIEGKERLKAEEQMQALKTMISAREKEIQFLYRHQRDIRFLAKRLYIELSLRLNKRANLTKSTSRLVYISDPRIKSYLEISGGKSAKEMLLFVHSRDSHNIAKRRQYFKSYLKTYFWKLAAKTYSLMTQVLKKVVVSL